MTGVLVLVVTLVVASAVGLVLRGRSGRMRPSPTPTAGRPETASPTGPAPDGIDLAAVGGRPGERATLLQFSSTFCAPCRATRAMLTDVAATVPGVAHVEVDVADGDAALDLVRRLDIRRTPTTLVLDGAGREVRRASGVPRREQVLAALAVASAPVPAGTDGHVR